MTTEYLRETRTSNGDTYTEVWHCPPPPEGVTYQVLDSEWNDDYTERSIYRIALVAKP